MTRSQAIQLIDLMKSKEVSFDPGLTDEEIRNVESKFTIKFPPDLSVFLKTSLPFETGNPVLSIHQMDIIYYGYDLANYLANEFGFKLPKEFNVLKKPNRDTRFWSQWTGELIK